MHKLVHHFKINMFNVSGVSSHTFVRLGCKLHLTQAPAFASCCGALLCMAALKGFAGSSCLQSEQDLTPSVSYTGSPACLHRQAECRRKKTFANSDKLSAGRNAGRETPAPRCSQTA